jgi:hypothetical protein
MKKIKNNIIFIIILIFLTNPAYSISVNIKNQYLYKYTLNKKHITISGENYKRLKKFFLGNFFSYEQNNFQSNANGVYYALSESGNASVMSFCNEKINNCILHNIKFITKKKCERISKEKCFIIASANKIILNKKIYKINNKNIEQIFTLILKIHPSNNSKQNISDIRINLYRDFDGSSDWE